MELYLGRTNQHDHKSVFLVSVDSNAHKTQLPTKELLSVLYIIPQVPFFYLPSSSKSQQINYLGYMKPKKVNQTRSPFQEVYQLTSQPICNLATRFRPFFYSLTPKKWHRLSAAWCNSQLHSRTGLSLWFSRYVIRFYTPLMPSLVLTEKLKPARGKQLPSSSYLRMRSLRRGIRLWGLLRTWFISLRRMETTLVYDIVCGIRGCYQVNPLKQIQQPFYQKEQPRDLFGLTCQQVCVTCRKRAANCEPYQAVHFKPLCSADYKQAMEFVHLFSQSLSTDANKLSNT